MLRNYPPETRMRAMDPGLAQAISEAGSVLRTLLDDITLAALSGDDPRPLVEQARDLADVLTDIVLRLNEDGTAEDARRMAAHLAADLALLENILSTETTAH